MKNSQENSQSRSTESSESDIQQRAYELFMRRGQEPGHELEDWLQAEREIRERAGRTKGTRTGQSR